MARKKVSPDAEVIDGIAEIDDDEQLVEETTRKVRRERVERQKAAPAPEPEIIDIELDDDDDPAERPPFSETSLAAKLFGADGEETYQNQFCTVNVRRYPDAMNDHFAEPNSNVATLPPLRNIDINAEQSDIEEIVRREYGGGHYFFQLHFNGSLGPSWKCTLTDLPAHMRPKAPTEPAAAPAAPTPAEPPRDPMDAMLDNLTKMKALRDILFGEERARLEQQIAEMKREIEDRPEPAPAAQLPENLAILEKALNVNNQTLQDKLLGYAFPEETAGHWIPETLKTIFEHKDEIGGILGGLLGGLAPKPQPQGIEAMLRGQPPTGTPAPAVQPSQFQRKQIPRSDDGETDADGPEAAIDGEIDGDGSGEQSAEFVNDVDGDDAGTEAGPNLDGKND